MSSHLNIARCMSFILFYFIFIFFSFLRSLYIRPALFLHCAVFRHREQRKPGSKTARFASKQVNDRKIAQGCHVVVLRHHVFRAKFRNLCYILCYVSNLNNFCSTFFFLASFPQKNGAHIRFVATPRLASIEIKTVSIIILKIAQAYSHRMYSPNRVVWVIPLYFDHLSGL